MTTGKAASLDDRVSLGGASVSRDGTALAISLIIPAFNEERRLPATLGALESFISRTSLTCEVIVVDNGSTDDTPLIVSQSARRLPWLHLLSIDERGKGVAVRTGMLAGRGDVLIFADADLSWSLGDLIRVPALISGDVPIVIGSREVIGAERVRTPVLRRLMSRIFNLIVQICVVAGIRDTQCGFKVFRADAARAIFAHQRINGFGFDVEILYLARRLGLPVLQTPMTWEHQEGSRVSPARDTLKMLLDVLQVRANAALGRYAATPLLGEPTAQPI